MIPLTKKEEKMHNEQEKKDALMIALMMAKKIYFKVKDHCHYTGKYRGAADDIGNLRCKIPKEILVVFHNGSTYDYHFIIKLLAEEFGGQFKCLEENTEKYITFPVSIKKEITKIDKDVNDKIVNISYKTKFIDSFRFMASSLSSYVSNLSDELHSDKCTDCKSCLGCMITKDDQLIFMCFECKKNYEKDFNKELIKRFANIYEFCNEDINKFILLLRKGVYPFEYMDSWERFDETSFPDKEAF